MSKKIDNLLGPWKDSNIKNKFKGSKSHKFLDRNRTLKINWLRLNKFIPEILHDKKPYKILDVASGNGATIEILNYFGHKAVGMDYSPGIKGNDWLYKPMFDSQNLRCKVHDGSSLPYPFKTKEFDFLICFGAITFFKPVEKWPKILNEFARLSKKGFLVGVNIGKVYDKGKRHLDSWSHPDFKLEFKSGSIYKWVRK